MWGYCLIIFIVVIALYVWAIKQRGGRSYFWAVSYTCACFTIALMELPWLLDVPVGSSAANSIKSYFDGTMRLSVIFFPITIAFAIILYFVGLIIGSKKIPIETTNEKIDWKKWILYVLINGIVVNSILFCVLSLADKLSIFAFVFSTTLIILHYPILCKMNRWVKKSLILAITMMCYFFFILLFEDGAIYKDDDIKISLFFAVLSFFGGSIYLMAIIWMNYALRKRLF